MIKVRLSIRILSLLGCLPFASCAYMSQSGPQKGSINQGAPSYKLIPVTSRADIPTVGRTYGQGQIPPTVHGSSYSDRIRSRDSLRFIITDLNEESPFFSRGDAYSYGPLEVPEDGTVSLPYIGEVEVSNRSMAQISEDVNDKLKPISKSARSSVARSGRIPRTANVLGEVKAPGPVPLERSSVTSVDLLAASGGPTGSEHLYKYTLRRGGADYVFDYQAFRQNPFPIEEGDLLSVSTDTGNRFYVMGAINKPTIVPFPVASPTLADALGAASGLDERRSDPSGVFVFRKGNPDEVYTINLKDPSALLLTQRFPIRGEDMVYVTEAPLARWNRMIMQVLPLAQLSTAAYNIDRIRTN